MRDPVELRARIEFQKTALNKLRAAYIALADGGVKTYTIDDRQVTKYDLPAIRKEIEAGEKKLDELNAELSNARPRKAFGVVPRDW